MSLRNRPFDSARDFEKMWRLLQQETAHKQAHYVWHCSRLGDWKFGLWQEKKLIPTFFRDHAQLWWDDFDQLVGFVLSENGDNLFFILTAPGYEYLYPETLTWTIRNWLPRYGTLKTEVHEFQPRALAALTRAGFRSLGVQATTRVYDLRVKVQEPGTLPDGFRIVNLCEGADYQSKGLLYKDGFDDEDTVTEFDLLRFAYSRENPAYDPQLDLSVVTGDGQYVATCVGFMDPPNRVAEVEKVCTHRQFRRLGLAESVIRACFHELAARGVERAFITGYSPAANALYEKLGPYEHKQWFHYEKPT